MGIDASQPIKGMLWRWVCCSILSFFLFFQNTALAFDSWGPSGVPNPLILAQNEPAPSEAAPQSKDTPQDTSNDQSGKDPAAQEGGVEEEDEEDEEEGPARIPLAGVQQGGVLLQRDQLVLEPTLGYSFATNSRLILSGFSVLPLIILGSLQSERVTTQTFAPAIGFRYGIKRGIQTDIRIPFLVQSISRLRVNTEQAGQSEISGEDAGLGDITFWI